MDGGFHKGRSFTSYSYDLNDRLTTLTQPGLSASFAYNGDGVRLAQTENGSFTRYLVDTQRSYSEVVGAYGPDSETYYLLGLDIIGQQQGSDWSYFGYDGLGSLRFALDASGSPSAGMRYEPYGQPVDSWGTPPALGFTGEWTDSSGMLYLRARYMDPSSATFLSRDPFEGLPTRVLSRNGYSWVEGNPINLIDPSGQFAVAVPWVLKAALGSGAAASFIAAAKGFAVAVGTAVQSYSKYAVGMLALYNICLPAITNLVDSVRDEIFGPSPQKVLGDRFGISPNGRGNPGFADHSDLRLSILSNPASSLQSWLEGYADHSDLRLSILSNPGSSLGLIGGLEGYPGETMQMPTWMADAAEPELRPYGGPGGGHHIHSKAAFRGNSGYSADEALALPNEAMEEGVHTLITSAQNTLFRELGRDVANNVRQNTLAEHGRIAIRALVLGGFTQQQASRWVAQSNRWLRSRGITKPECIPWVDCS